MSHTNEPKDEPERMVAGLPEKMVRRQITLRDGRYLIFFTFLPDPGAPSGEGGRRGNETV